MRRYLHINLQDKSVREEQFAGEQIAWAGRYFISRTLVKDGIATVEPLSPRNPLIFSAGPFAGSNWSNANRISVGCKSPLTGGIKESNGGGSFGFALGQLEIAGFTLHGAAADWVVIHLCKDGTVNFDSASAYLGKGNFDCARLLHEQYGNKVSLGICGPVGEYQGLLAGIAFSDVDQRPSRLSARGGVGAVLGSKKVKAIVVDMHKMPTFQDRKKVMQAVREYGAKIQADAAVDNYRQNGTASMGDYINHVGALPVNNFSLGRQVDTEQEPLKMGGAYIREQNVARGGNPSHACMPGCLIECSNVYVDEQGKEITSPVEFETLGLMGTNCGLKDPDDLARLNNIANDLGIDTIETGAMLAVLMDAGLASFGDIEFMHRALEEIRNGTDNGRLWAQGTARVGAHYGVKRVPVIKQQAISAYDPRVIEVTGLSMMMTAQGADHTTGNVPTYDSLDKDLDHLVDVSIKSQITNAATDSLGLCVFGRSVTTTNIDLIVQAINAALGTDLDNTFFYKLGYETLKYEAQFNQAAGFTTVDDELPEFFYSEALAPSNKVARFHSDELRESVKKWWRENTAG
ncbi:MAG: Tungsten-containing aldehyde ferredoxin oxidoreductase [Gammaproteobacteria bacterium]|nr:Tungsten-containing aldehyde ferredoxin oxidoreductase [Gammaproteobacteria bacterium]